MLINFTKMHGAGNDFIVIDNRNGSFNTSDADFVKLLCHRRFGIGADGMILLEEEDGYDFKMVFMNNDGSIGSMCGNGGRCIVHFAYHTLDIISNPKQVRFMAVDGIHEAEINGDQVKLKMQDVSEISIRNGLTFLRSGTTPHHISFVENLENFPVCTEARIIRDNDDNPNGVNVNYVEEKDGVFHVRTYERGVEDETLACGTGATSVAIALSHLGKLGEANICKIKMPGGELEVCFEKMPDRTYENIWLTGPAVKVFEGKIEL